jgi:hypothetical protein
VRAAAAIKGKTRATRLMNNSNDLGMGYLLELEIDQVRFWQTIPGEAQRKIFFAKQKRRFL